MSTLIIPFRTLRMHDSPFLNLKGNLIFKFILETNKIPNKSPFDEKLNSTTWSIPMAWFYINCLENHVKDLHNAGFDVEVVVTDNPNKTIQDILATKNIVNLSLTILMIHSFHKTLMNLFKLKPRPC